MLKKINNLASFRPDAYYHVVNRTNNKEVLFRSDEDRSLFLDKYKKYVAPYVDTFAWCLMANHFHVCIRIKSAASILETTLTLPEDERTSPQRKLVTAYHNGEILNFHSCIERQFTRLFTSYAMRFNLMKNRKGNLFYRPFKRVEAENFSHLLWLVFYIHNNPVKHKITHTIESYPWSSFHTFKCNSNTLLRRDEVLEWFGGRDNFLKFHEDPFRFEPDSPLFFELD